MSEKNIEWAAYHVAKMQYFPEKLHTDLKKIGQRKHSGDEKKELERLRQVVKAYKYYEKSTERHMTDALTHLNKSESESVSKAIEKAEREVISQIQVHLS